MQPLVAPRRMQCVPPERDVPGVDAVFTGRYPDAEVRAAVEEAVAFAQASPLPRPEDALLDVFAP